MARLLQLVKENIGMAQATEDLAEVKHAKDEMKILKNWYTKLQNGSKGYGAEMLRLGTEGVKLSTTFNEWSMYEQQQGTALGNPLGRTSDMQIALNNLEQAMGHQVGESLAVATRNFLEKDLKFYSGVQGKQENARIAYDIALNAFRPLENKSGPKYDQKRQAAEEHMNAAKATYDQLSNELVTLSDKIKQKHSLVLQLSLLNYLRALHAHFRQGYNMMETLDGFMGELQHNVTTLQESGLNVDDQTMYQTPDAVAAAAPVIPTTQDSVPPPSYAEDAAPAYEEVVHVNPPPFAGGGQPPMPTPMYAPQPTTTLYPQPGAYAPQPTAPPSQYDAAPVYAQTTMYAAPPPGYSETPLYPPTYPPSHTS